MRKGQYTPEQSAKMLRIRFPDPESCIAALATISRLPPTEHREALIEDLFITFELAGFDRQTITTLGLTHCETTESSLPDQETEMPRPKGSQNKSTIAASARRRKDQVNEPFHAALKSAESLLAARRRELEEAQATARKLMIEIPNLELTISALNRQLNPAQASPLPVMIGSTPVRPAAPTEEAAGINEVQDGMGVVLTTNEPVIEAAPDIDSIPGMEGQWT